VSERRGRMDGRAGLERAVMLCECGHPDTHHTTLGWCGKPIAGGFIDITTSCDCTNYRPRSQRPDSRASSDGERSAESVAGSERFSTWCTHCNSTFEGDDATTTCPHCGEPWAPAPRPNMDVGLLGMRRRGPSIRIGGEAFTEDDVLEAARRSGLSPVRVQLLVDALADVWKERTG